MNINYVILNIYLKTASCFNENLFLNYFKSIIYFVHMAAMSLFKILFILGVVAFYTIAERKIMGAVQRRKGPNVVGILGLLQPLADGFKLIIKELLVPTHSTSKIYLITPMIMLFLSWVGWAVLPFKLYDVSLNEVSFVSDSLISTYQSGYSKFKFLLKSFISNFNYNLLILLFLSSVNVYSLILAGWSSNSKYAFLGALRSSAQMIAYEVSLGLTLLPLILFSGSFNLVSIMLNQRNVWHVSILIIPAIIFFVSMLAELNRTPFDLTEAEAELVAGYNVEYSSIVFSMFFLGEYSNMLVMSSLFCIFYLGGSYSNLLFYNSNILFSLKVLFVAFLIVLIRATFPRYRYDQLMYLGWKIFLLFAFANLVANLFIVYGSYTGYYTNFLI